MKTGILLLVVAGAVLIGSVWIVRSAAQMLLDPMRAETIAKQHVEDAGYGDFGMVYSADDGFGHYWYIFRNADRRYDVDVRKDGGQWHVKGLEMRDKAAAAHR